MLNDKLSLKLCGSLAGVIFVSGVFGILDNFIVLTLITLIFIAIIGNIFYTKMKEKEENSNVDSE